MDSELALFPISPLFSADVFFKPHVLTLGCVGRCGGPEVGR